MPAKTKKTPKKTEKKPAKYLFPLKISIGVFFILLAVYLLSFTWDFSGGQKPAFGVTFSKKYAEELGLDWTRAYIATLNELRVSHIRLIAYWNEIEPEPGRYDFESLDWQIRQAEDRRVKIQLIFGRRTPRWPECHDPLWLDNLDQTAANQKLIELIDTVVNRYKDNRAIIAWQVENEPFLSIFGECPVPNRKLLFKEVSRVKEIDPTRPVIVTDSGELSTWQNAAALPDVFGTTLYRIVWNRYFGFFDYFFVPPAYYRLKADLTRLFHPNLKDVIVTELQMEPWTFDKPMIELTSEERGKSFSAKRFNNNIDYVTRTGFKETYLWGVEYWYWLKEHNEPQIWDQAKKLWAR